MKKIIALSFLITFYFLAFGQKNTLIKTTDTTEIVTLDSSQSVQEFLIHWQAWYNTCGEEGLALINQGQSLGVSVVQEFKDLPAPITQDAVKQWTDKIDLLFGGIGSIITMLLTFLLSLFKKDPQGTITQVQAFVNKVRTRYLLAFSSVVVAAIGVLKYGDGNIGFSDVLAGLGLAVTVATGGNFFRWALKKLGIDLTAKKV